QGSYTVHQGRLLTTDGLTATLSRGWFGGCKILSDDDCHTFDSPQQETAIALHVVEETASGQISLQPYVWDPQTEVKGDSPAGCLVLQADLLRGVLPAGATSLDDLEEEDE
ncbi:MAG: hypothetical protein JRJ59_07360, partial [Deltaproteobacteria bacterium]|nr:hypothetical protein [Deltaproteobacteria bacterium]